MRYNKYHTARWVAYRKWWRALHGMALRISHLEAFFSGRRRRLDAPVERCVDRVDEMNLADLVREISRSVQQTVSNNSKTFVEIRRTVDSTVKEIKDTVLETVDTVKNTDES